MAGDRRPRGAHEGGLGRALRLLPPQGRSVDQHPARPGDAAYRRRPGGARDRRRDNDAHRRALGTDDRDPRWGLGVPWRAATAAAWCHRSLSRLPNVAHDDAPAGPERRAGDRAHGGHGALRSWRRPTRVASDRDLRPRTSENTFLLGLGTRVNSTSRWERQGASSGIIGASVVKALSKETPR